MNSIEQRATFSLATLFSLRMLGLFMVLPVFTPYAKQLLHATPLLIGVAIGIYGLSQALLQLPLGSLSDRYPRKLIIAFGFIIFTFGSIVAALSHSIYGVIIGRTLQGAGAIGSTIIALLTDLTRSEKRSKAMAIIGVIIGSSFFLAFLLGPVFTTWIGVTGIFWLTALFGVLAIILLYTLVPTAPDTLVKTTLPFRQQYKILLRDKSLLSLNIGIFCLHVILTANFVVLPLLLQQLLGTTHSATVIYLPTLLLAILFTFLFIGWAEKSKRTMQLYINAIIVLIIAQLGLWIFHQQLLLLSIGLMLFFTAFNILEANLPSLISRLAPATMKGSAIGIYSTYQFMGIFCGGLLGGWLYGHTSPATVLLACAIIGALWLGCTFILQPSHPTR